MDSSILFHHCTASWLQLHLQDCMAMPLEEKHPKSLKRNDCICISASHYNTTQHNIYAAPPAGQTNATNVQMKQLDICTAWRACLCFRLCCSSLSLELHKQCFIHQRLLWMYGYILAYRDFFFICRGWKDCSAVPRNNKVSFVRHIKCYIYSETRRTRQQFKRSSRSSATEFIP